MFFGYEREFISILCFSTVCRHFAGCCKLQLCHWFLSLWPQWHQSSSTLFFWFILVMNSKLINHAQNVIEFSSLPLSCLFFRLSGIKNKNGVAEDKSITQSHVNWLDLSCLSRRQWGGNVIIVCENPLWEVFFCDCKLML